MECTFFLPDPFYDSNFTASHNSIGNERWIVKYFSERCNLNFRKTT